MNKEELKDILKQHHKWVISCGDKGKKAYLSEADLRGADLRETDLKGADLRGAYLTDSGIFTAQYGKHFAFCYGNFIQIGCLNKSILEWLEEYDEVGSIEGYTDLEISMYGDFIKTMAKARGIK